MSNLFLHKFRSVNDRLLSGVLNSQVYFSKPGALNDPFDCQIRFHKAFCKAHEFPIEADNLTLENEDTLSKVLAYAKEKGIVKDRDPYGTAFVKGIASLYRRGPSWGNVNAAQVLDKLETMFSNFLNTIGVLSFSTGRTPHQPLMWSHYANEHRGICLTYELLEDSFCKSLIAAKGAVQYNETDLVDAIRAYRPTRYPTYDEFKNIALTLLSTKSPEWSYENEFRLVAASAGLHYISKESLRAICFGLRTTLDDKIKIRNLVKEAGYHNCVFTQAIQSKSELFDIEIRPTSEDEF